jgi:hypothetical protein
MTDKTIDYIGPNELVFNMDKDGGIFSGGFNVNSIMMKAGMSPIMTLNSGQLGGNNSNVSDLFKDLVIPNWALSYHSKMTGGEYKDDTDSDSDSDSDSDIDDDLHDKLVNLVRENEEKLKQKSIKKSTLRQKGGSKKNTRRKK